MAGTKALVVALNPLPVVDVIGGLAIDALMIVTLSKVYGLNFSMAQARGLAKSIGKAAGVFALGELTSWGCELVQRPNCYAWDGDYVDPTRCGSRVQFVYRRERRQEVF